MIPAFLKLAVNTYYTRRHLQSRNELFERQSVQSTLFEIKLVQFLAITVPFARAIKCLESASATAADVYAFWLAIMSRLEYIMANGNRTKLSNRTMEDVRAISNQRFKELLEDGPTDIYHSALALHPGKSTPYTGGAGGSSTTRRTLNCGPQTQPYFAVYRDAPILKATNGANPLAIPSLRIHRDESGTPSVKTSGTPTSDRDKLIERVGLCLQDLLLREYGGMEAVDRTDIGAFMKNRNPLLASILPLDALSRVKTELTAFMKAKEPFNRPLRPKETVLDWWIKVQRDDCAQVLGVRCYIHIHFLIIFVISHRPGSDV